MKTSCAKHCSKRISKKRKKKKILNQTKGCQSSIWANTRVLVNGGTRNYGGPAGIMVDILKVVNVELLHKESQFLGCTFAGNNVELRKIFVLSLTGNNSVQFSVKPSVCLTFC